jgi:hypothetical protein
MMENCCGIIMNMLGNILELDGCWKALVSGDKPVSKTGLYVNCRRRVQTKTFSEFLLKILPSPASITDNFESITVSMSATSFDLPHKLRDLIYKEVVVLQADMFSHWQIPSTTVFLNSPTYDTYSLSPTYLQTDPPRS